MWQFRKTDHNLSYRGPIWVIQKPNIKFSKSTTISMKETSPISPFFSDQRSIPKSGKYVGSKQGSLWQSRKMDYNLSYRGPIWVIPKPNLKFTIQLQFPRRTLVQIPSFSNRKSAPKSGHHIGSKHGAIPICPKFCQIAPWGKIWPNNPLGHRIQPNSP